MPGRERQAGLGGGVWVVKIPSNDDRVRRGPYLVRVEVGDVVRLSRANLV